MKDQVERIKVKDFRCPICKQYASAEVDKYLGGNKELYPVLIPHNEKENDHYVPKYINGEYQRFEWTEIHFCNTCNIEYEFDDCSI